MMAKYCSSCNRETQQLYDVGVVIWRDNSGAFEDFHKDKPILDGVCLLCAEEKMNSI